MVRDTYCLGRGATFGFQHALSVAHNCMYSSSRDLMLLVSVDTCTQAHIPKHTRTHMYIHTHVHTNMYLYLKNNKNKSFINVGRRKWAFPDEFRIQFEL